MAECRYFPECQRCNEVGDSWLPCAGGADVTRCKGYEPMPDVKALLALADEMEEFGNLPVKHLGVRVLHNDDFSRELGYARRIREACGHRIVGKGEPTWL